jgi:L,D-transpeptidase YcbB
MPTPVPVRAVLAGRIQLHFLVLMLTLTLGVAVAPLGAATPPPSVERLQLRLGALAEDPRVAGQPVADPWFLTRFYERREFAPAWNSAAKLHQLLAAIAGSLRHGLEPEDYYHALLAELLETLEREPNSALAVEVELLATEALARLAFHLRFGKVNPERVETTWNFSRTTAGVSPVTTVQSLVQTEDISLALEAYAPDEDFYRALVHVLATYREIANSGGWPAIGVGETLRIGDRSERVGALRTLLAIVGDLPAETTAEQPVIFDEALEAAVVRFQLRHGLEPDGAVGRQTLAALNVPVEARINQLRVNLERVRWVFHDLDDRFLLVNIARFRVLLVENRRVTWSTRAVVGRPYRQTPVFKARMTYLEFNPTWTVPPTILRNDLLPELRRDPQALERRNMSVLDHQGQRVDPAGIDWSSVTPSTFPYMLRQEPGPDNALGRVKFMYPNPYHVYMHDTPARNLFARAERTFSSGCIRLEQPLELAKILLAGTQWDDAAIDRALATGRTRIVNLPQPIPVLTLYGTAVPDVGGIHFAADVYGRDARLLAALDAPFEFTAPAGFYEEAGL